METKGSIVTMETRNVRETPPKQRKYVSARDKRSSAVVVVFRYKAECGEYNSFRSLRAHCYNY